MLRKISVAHFASVFLPLRSSRHWHVFLILVLTLIGCLVGNGRAMGQSTTSVRGTVTDPYANAVVGADRCARECRIQDGTDSDNRGSGRIPVPSYSSRNLHPFRNRSRLSRLRTEGTGAAGEYACHRQRPAKDWRDDGSRHGDIGGSSLGPGGRFDRQFL